MQTNQVSVITGGGRGIGKAISFRMAKETNLIIVGRTIADLETTCAEINSSGGNAIPCVADITDPETGKRVVSLIQDNGWVLKNLICNAGIGKGGPTQTFDDKLWQSIFDTNINGHFMLIKACLPLMLEQQRGTICLMSSMAGIKGYAHIAAYTASKHALVGLARSLGQEYGKKGIVTVAICPGFVESEMTNRSINGLAERRHISEAEAREIIGGINPQHRIIPAEEVAEMVAFVCENKVPSLNGNPIILSGGE